jgi:flagellar biosynthetic protein FlhB
MVPDLNRMNPISGMAKMVSARGFVELLKSILKIFIVGYVVYVFLQAELPNFTKLAEMSLRDSVSVVALMCWRMMIKAAAAMAMIAIIDYGYQRWSFEQSIKMTKQEVRDEYKMQEGDPQLKGQIRQRQREMVKRRMMQNVPKADVIITNPTHYAVAIQYDPEKMGAPTVVAKGQRLVAQKIKDVAIANGVPIVENKPVARALYAAVEVGDQIPEDLYQAVAEILAYVFRISKKAGRVGYSTAY